MIANYHADMLRDNRSVCIGNLRVEYRNNSAVGAGREPAKRCFWSVPPRDTSRKQGNEE